MRPLKKIFDLNKRKNKQFKVTSEFQEKVMSYIEANGFPETKDIVGIKRGWHLNSIACRGHGTVESVIKVRKALIQSGEADIAIKRLSPELLKVIAARVKLSRDFLDDNLTFIEKPPEGFQLSN